MELVPSENQQHRVILESHFVSPESHAALMNSQYEEFARLRSQRLIAAEREFMEEHGLRVPQQPYSTPNIDSEEMTE